jgi:hypothetical protein
LSQEQSRPARLLVVRSGSELGGRRDARFSRGRAVEIGGGSGTSSICDGLPDAFRRGGHVEVRDAEVTEGVDDRIHGDEL